MMKEAIAKLMNKQDLTYEEARQVMDEIMDGKVSATLISSYLTALSMKGETIDEISGSAYAMRAHATKAPHDMDVLEIVGTGGDGANTFNISSTSAMVIAAGGVPVAKHGNRAASSLCGTADCLEALGVNIDQTPPSPVLRTYWRRWASTSPCPRKNAGHCWSRWASAFCLPRPITPP